MATQEYQTPQNEKSRSKSSAPTQNGQTREGLLSPRFRTAAAMAGWDEEALLLAALVVEDTPERDSKQKKRLLSQTSLILSADSRTKRSAKRRRAVVITGQVLSLDDCEEVPKGSKVKKNDSTAEEKKKGDEESLDKVEKASTSVPELPCIDRLREELSCAICLDICYEPSTTPCGHSFCKKCLKSAADKCGKKCPKCRQLIGNGRSCSVNTVLWNTIQLLFPQEIEAKKSSKPSHEQHKHETPKDGHRSRRHGVVLAVSSDAGSGGSRIRGRRAPTQAEDAALALRLQREEFMDTFLHGSQTFEPPMRSFTSARAHLRALASRAAHLRTRGHQL